MFLTLFMHVLNSVSIEYYLLYDLLSYILCKILNYKNLQFKQFINNIAIDLYVSRNFADMEDIKRRCRVVVLKFCS